MARDDKGQGSVLIVTTHRDDRRVLFDTLDGQNFDAIYTAKDLQQALASMDRILLRSEQAADNLVYTRTHIGDSWRCGPCSST